ncbi:DUF1769-domain-containing protein [Schizophyllum commune H4-8]|uniref:DUF1769-domain-containing protein n=1 Tax=Schizophyllum commune (strain H4-8 / FGSC 9210) TaxID=578458 RepID=UPI00215FE739|nr:DUF1769-domain-containing protein [Schizophyllum commune H4-8]KAI5885082.1 DUF1769-domain-containing protein [Schizophyllum commune H4-8]
MPTKRLRVLAGPTADPANMSDITQLVNSPTPFEIKSEDFEGRIVACIKDFHAGVGEGEGGTEDGEGKDDKNDGSWYFGRADRQGVTWSIQVQGRFLKPHPASNILFGNIFDRPLRLPWGSGAALKFMSFIDPTLTHDLGSQTTPWALSPLVSTMPYLDISPAGQEPAFPHGDKVSGSPSSEPSPVSSPEASRPPSKAPSRASSIKSIKGRLRSGSRASVLSSSRGSPPSASKEPSRKSSLASLRHKSSIASIKNKLAGSSSKLTGSSSKAPSRAGTRPPTPVDEDVADVEDATPLGEGATGEASTSIGKEALAEDAADALSWTFDNASARKAHFSTPAAREEAVLGPDTVVTCDFAYGFLSFSPSISLVLPGGLSFDLMRYWDGQPVRFVCCERASGGGKRDANGVRQDVGGSEELPWGKVIWSVCIELVEEDD